MTATVIHPTEFRVVFWDLHKDGRDVTLCAVQVLAAYRLLGLAVKGMTFRPETSPVRFFNRVFDRKYSAARWQELLAPRVEDIHAHIEFCSAHPGNCLTAEAD